MPMTCQERTAGSRATSDRGSRARRHAAGHAQDERELQRLFEEILLQERKGDLEVTAVVDLELRLHAQLAHTRREPPHAVGGVAELARPEGHRADVERRHPRTGLDQLHAVLVVDVQAHAG